MPVDENGYIIRDADDVGVPMRPGGDHQGPEDAFDPNARGVYTDRVVRGPSVLIRRDDDGTLEQVKQGA
jgi:hypothetical protein